MKSLVIKNKCRYLLSHPPNTVCSNLLLSIYYLMHFSQNGFTFETSCPYTHIHNFLESIDYFCCVILHFYLFVFFLIHCDMLPRLVSVDFFLWAKQPWRGLFSVLFFSESGNIVLVTSVVSVDIIVNLTSAMFLIDWIQLKTRIALAKKASGSVHTNLMASSIICQAFIHSYRK